MQPRDIEKLAPHWGVEAGLVPNESMQRLHDATGQLDAWTDALALLIDPHNKALLDILCAHLTLDPHYEAFFSARVFPTHDTFMKDGTAINSRFLVVDSRNPFKEPNQDNAVPVQRMRSYFLVVGPDVELPSDPTNIFPYFTTTDLEAAPEDLVFRRYATDVCHARYSGDMPLETGPTQPRRVHDMDIYDAMAQEIQRAVAKFEGSTAEEF